MGSVIPLMTEGRLVLRFVEPKKEDGTMMLAELEARVKEDVERRFRGAREGPPALTV